jgi:hypothetical protein
MMYTLISISSHRFYPSLASGIVYLVDANKTVKLSNVAFEVTIDSETDLFGTQAQREEYG